MRFAPTGGIQVYVWCGYRDAAYFIDLHFPKTPRHRRLGLLIRPKGGHFSSPGRCPTRSRRTTDRILRAGNQALFAALGIEMDLVPTPKPAQKGHVERAIKTYQPSVRAALCRAMSGTVVSDRKGSMTQRALPARLGQDTARHLMFRFRERSCQALVDEWCEKLL